MGSMARSFDSVDCNELLLAFLILTEGACAGSTSQQVSGAEANEIIDRIARRLGADKWLAIDLFRRCCAMANFFAVEANCSRIGVDQSKPEPAMWRVAASVPVRRTYIDGAPCYTFDPIEFSAALRDK